MILSIASQKGGTGKTTTAITLAACLGRSGKKVLVIDIDSQANASKVLLPNYLSLKKEETIFVTILERKALPISISSIPNVYIVPSHILLSNTDMELSSAVDHREERLLRALNDIKNEYDHIIIDCPPSLSWLTINAFSASENVLIPIAPGYFELDSIMQINKTMEEVIEYFNPNLKLAGYLFTMSDPTVNSRTSLKLLRQTYTSEVLNTVIPRNTDIRDAHFNKKDIFAFRPESKSAKAYLKLMKELYE